MKRNLTTHNRAAFDGIVVAVGLALAVIIAVFAGGGTMLLATAPTAQQALDPTTVAQAQDSDVDAYTKIATRDFGTWGYSTVRFTNRTGLRTGIYYNHDSVRDIQNYVAANKALLADVVRAGGQAEIAVTFVWPMAPDQFRAWAKQNTVQVKQAQIAVGAPGGSGGTLIISGSADDPLPESSIGKFPFSGMGGVFGLYGTADAKQLAMMAADPAVFLVDVTPAWSRLDLLKQDVADAAQAETAVALPFGWMERLGMVPTPVGLPSPVTTRIPTVLPIAP